MATSKPDSLLSRPAPFGASLQTASAIASHFLADEEALLRQLLAHPATRTPSSVEVEPLARELIQSIRAAPAGIRMETLLQEYSLDTREGITLMCLAEALHRIPDEYTAEQFLQEKLEGGDWSRHIGHSDSFWVNASTWGLLLAGKLFHQRPAAGSEQGRPLHGDAGVIDSIQRLIHRVGEPVALSAIKQAMGLLGHQFVAGESIGEALSHSHTEKRKGYRHSFDMLGEAAMTQADVKRYTDAYAHAIDTIAAARHDDATSLSIKLSAFHPRFEPRQPDALKQLQRNVMAILEHARSKDIAVTIDAEESWRLEPSLALFAEVLRAPTLRRWGKIGLAVRAYQKRALPVLQWLGELSHDIQASIPVRLVKGAYWDAEIKWAQIHGLRDYPVFTRKAATDLNYQHCARYLLAEQHLLLPQFATHNAWTVASIIAMAKHAPARAWEFQRLHGMGSTLYDHLLQRYPEYTCRIYAPVGNFKELLPYLVRRLLENGANTSFIRKINNPDSDIASLLEAPADILRRQGSLRNSRIPLPRQLFGTERKNSQGLLLECGLSREKLMRDLSPWMTHRWQLDGGAHSCSPANCKDMTGSAISHDKHFCQEALKVAERAATSWRNKEINERASLLEQAGDALEQHYPELLALLMREAGKTLPNAIAEVREAVDFCRYYAAQARTTLSPRVLPGPTGESNILRCEGRGVFLCISPWNFPLAIFVGQIAAALVAGNCVLAKCSQLTPLIARRAVEIFHDAGIPQQVLHYINSTPAVLEHTVLEAATLSGVMFTGSHKVAQHINRILASRTGAILPFIAETGGMNAMIVDSSALPDQVVRDIVTSAFDSAGQRCSALRVLFLQDDIHDSIMRLLEGWLEQQNIGDNTLIDTDIGPVISEIRRRELEQHVEKHHLDVLFRADLSRNSAPDGHIIAPTIIALKKLDELKEEIFGPILHVIRYKAEDIDDVIEQINASGFGLTFGVHTRINGRIERFSTEIKSGNIYINRSMIGATVGVQPFGGQGLSGTGPKAGGPHYLLRLVNEKTVTCNTSAAGGNTRLLTDASD